MKINEFLTILHLLRETLFQFNLKNQHCKTILTWIYFKCAWQPSLKTTRGMFLWSICKIGENLTKGHFLNMCKHRDMIIPASCNRAIWLLSSLGEMSFQKSLGPKFCNKGIHIELLSPTSDICNKGFLGNSIKNYLLLQPPLMPSLLPSQTLQLALLSLTEPLINGTQWKPARVQEVQTREVPVLARGLQRAPASCRRVHQERQAVRMSTSRIHGRSF